MPSVLASDPSRRPAAPSRSPPPPPPEPDVVTKHQKTLAAMTAVAEDATFAIQRKPVPALTDSSRRVASEGTVQSRVRAIVDRFEQPDVIAKTIPLTRRLTGMGMALQQRKTSTPLRPSWNNSKCRISIETEGLAATEDNATTASQEARGTTAAAVKDVTAKKRTTLVKNFDAEAYIRAAKATVEQAKLRATRNRPDLSRAVGCDHESICITSSTAAPNASASSENSAFPGMTLSLDGTPIETAIAVVPIELDGPRTISQGKPGRSSSDTESVSISSSCSRDADANDPERGGQDGASGDRQAAQQQVARKSLSKQRNSRNLTIATTPPQDAAPRRSSCTSRDTLHTGQPDSLRYTSMTATTATLPRSSQTSTPTMAAIKQAAITYTFLFSPTDEASSSQRATPLHPPSTMSSTTAFSARSFETISPASPSSVRSACSLHPSSPMKAIPPVPASTSNVDKDTAAPVWMGSRTDSSGSSVVLNTMYDRTLEEDSIEVLRYKQFFHQPLGRCLDSIVDDDVDAKGWKRLFVTIAEMGGDCFGEGEWGFSKTDIGCEITDRRRASPPKDGGFEQKGGLTSAETF